MADPNLINNFNGVSTNEENLENKAKAFIHLDNGAATFQKSLWPKLKSLTHLDLSECNISVLPEALCDLTALRFFQASNNLLTCLPLSIGQLKDLIKLILPFNKLSTLPSSFADLNALEHLNLSHNEFKRTPNCFQVLYFVQPQDTMIWRIFWLVKCICLCLFICYRRGT